MRASPKRITEFSPEKNNNSSPYSKKGPSSNAHQTQFYNPVELKSPDTLLQTDMTQQDFSHALFSSIDLIPDVPFDIADYKPQNLVNTPAEYPQSPNMKLLQSDFFRRYDLSTLFYIFFYFPGTPQQLFSGNELKQRGWRFHTKYQTWFHRISEPTEITDHYEIGAFEYFDHNTQDGWCVRVRNSFKLEYECLETE
ncbi:hypothetical protein TRFO_37562 [Tritrichomonas foetus]|uniref:NOT2/NOT3/NOT5 C-terminal domain-containing protein n=1 Tax=Tritrichomonas foetus TaxID=1144522 RepID=A0A1J4JC99_9EUKA|nr:hypothetical protein TRFO_37562 [Tritrichomonas foetus]|eukprot:OHS96289.1 hypothetical protein TRFO_37562 [Tritrichomonas foetus]